MSSKERKKKPSPGTTTPTQFRLGPDSLAKLDEIMVLMGATTRTETVRRLIHDAHRKGVKP
jgi:hypothetical protein